MYSLAPYFIRCYDKNNESKNVEERYDFLNRIGQYDIFKLLDEFISLHKDFEKIDDSKETYKFHNVTIKTKERVISGWMSLGHYGIKNDIINTDDNKLAFSKEENHADVKNYYFRFYLPLESRKGICLLYAYKKDGIKSVFQKEFSNFFTAKTNKNIQINPLTYDKAVIPWLDAETKEIRVIGFTAPKSLEDSISSLGDIEGEYVLKPKRNGTFGKFVSFRKKGTKQAKLVELLSEEASQVKVKVVMEGGTKTFRVGKSERSTMCQIEIDLDVVKVIAGSPEFSSLDSWASGLIKELSKEIGL
ncbi:MULTISPECIES: hypothetical protein [Pectobacterium]|uniref:hypothetical protein n=1 Tax=Pectobacterium TaxID=122277 RepID=UPI000EB36DB8|nr:hypothetical protein [Pectobacterium parmentieri]AYH36016.1 hypothetical protein C5E17_08335 [Pectobacterium parmentieri]